MITVVLTEAFVGKKLTQPGKGSRRERSPCEVGAACSLTEQAEGGWMQLFTVTNSL